MEKKVAEYEKDLTIYPFLDRMAFTMPENYIDWDLIDAFDDSEPSSKEYRRLMKEMKITGRLNARKRKGPKNENEWN